MVPWWLPVDLPNISAIIDCLETLLVPIERYFQGLSIAIETVRIDGELMEIWLNEVCDITPSLGSSSVEKLSWLWYTLKIFLQLFACISHVSSPWVYPFHLTRYSFFPCLCRKSRIFSTSHSSWPCIKVGGGGVAFWPRMVDSEYWVNLLAWKTGCNAR